MIPFVTARELRELLAGQDPPHVLDVSFHLGGRGGGARDYAAAHVPGAVFVDVDEVFAEPVAPGGTGGRHPLPSAERLQHGLRLAGVTQRRAVVVYDQGTGMGAARAWWVLRDAGVDVRVLAGGLPAWRSEGLPLSTEPAMPPEGDVVVRPGGSAQVDADEVAGLTERGARMVDVRAAERYRGETEPLDRVAGHIPGAVNLPFTDLQDEQGQLLDVEALRQRLGALEPGDAVSCGSGITASYVLLAAEHAGVRGLALYPGSWSDWISDPDRPVATGEGPADGADQRRRGA